MALPMLVGGADCGPSNPLQGLSKRFDQDRGIQQDFYGAGRAGSSREAFRTQQGNSSQDHDAARFFSGHTAAQSPSSSAAYDLSAMHATLPVPMNYAPQVQQQAPLASWAADFMQQAPSVPQQNVQAQADSITRHASPAVASPQGGMQWAPTPALPNFRMNSMPGYVPQIPMQNHLQQPPVSNSKSISWDKEFLQAQESLFAPDMPALVEVPDTADSFIIRANGSVIPAKESDDLARTAGLLLDNLKHEQNPKFQKSQFMGLMKQLRDGQVVVDGNEIVESDGRTTSSSQSQSQSQSQAQVDLKGKGRALAPETVMMTFAGLGKLNAPWQPSAQVLQNETQASMAGTQEDADDAYWRQENEDFTRYWNESRAEPTDASLAKTIAEISGWDKLQADWDNFEATDRGIKPVAGYQFQANNPYVLGDSSRTQHHLMHTEGRRSTLESVLELEASVQRNPNDAEAWYGLGVKQQENEREHKATQALERAVQLDPAHLPAWLALAVSYTNDNNRQGTYDSVYEWVTRNAKYDQAVQTFRALNPENPHLTLSDRYGKLIACLITMATSDRSGDVDADIQIALAVLLNTNEEYGKAQDCFSTALAVRPDDWLLYNRVGATMANSGRADEALDYYYRALELNPGYIRARFNLGISCINLRRYEEAAQHILDALVLQDSDGLGEDVGSDSEKRGIVSTVLWDTLKTTSLHMQRPDLAALCDNKDLEGFRNRFV